MTGGNKSISFGILLHWNSVEMWKQQFKQWQKQVVVTLKTYTQNINRNIFENIGVL